MVAAYRGRVDGDAAVLAVTALNGVAGYYVPDHSGILSLHGTIPPTLADLVGDPISGNIIEDPWGSPCLELISAARGANSFAMVDVCTRATDTVEPSWRTPGVESTILLDPPAPIDVAPIIADVDVDGHLDVLVGAGGTTYVAHGDGAGLAAAVPYPLPFRTPMPCRPTFPCLSPPPISPETARWTSSWRSLLVSLPPLQPGALPRYASDQVNVASRGPAPRLST